ncbi:hypothetical protein ACQY0O_007714 [Thecaphora frezii]
MVHSRNPSSLTWERHEELTAAQHHDMFNAAFAQSVNVGSSTLLHDRAGDLGTSSEVLGLHSGPSRPSLHRQPRTYHDPSGNLSMSSLVDKEDGISPLVNTFRSPYPSPSPHFLTVMPPLNFPLPSGANSSHLDLIRRGSLLPLYPTLGGQLWAISREYGLPSIGGLVVYLAEDVDGNMGPQIGDAAWSALWSQYFADDDSAFFGSWSAPNSSSQKRPNYHTHDAQPDSVLDFNDSDLSRSSDADMSKSRSRLGVASSRPSPRMDAKASLRRDPAVAAEWSPSSRSMGWSGRGSSMANRTGASFSSERLASRLPIVGKIEWMVDESKASWWSAWAARKALQSGTNASQVPRRSLRLQVRKPTGPSRTKSQGMFASSFPEAYAPRNQAPSPSAIPLPASPQSTERSITGPNSFEPSPAPEAALSAMREGECASEAESRIEPRVASLTSDSMVSEHERLENYKACALSAVEVKSRASFEVAASVDEGAGFDHAVERNLALSQSQRSLQSHISAGDDSYAGYSALLDDGETHNENLSDPAQEDSAVEQKEVLAGEYSHLGSDRSSSEAEVLPFEHRHEFVLEGGDEEMWKDLHQTEDVKSEVPDFFRPRPRSLHSSVAPRSPLDHVDEVKGSEEELLLAHPNGVRLSQSAIDRHVSLSPQIGTQDDEVHKWIKKTSGSPRSGLEVELDALDTAAHHDLARHSIGGPEAQLDGDGNDQREEIDHVTDDAYPSDVREVVSLWANQVAQSSEHLPLMEPPSVASMPAPQDEDEAESVAVTDPDAAEESRGLEVADGAPPNAASQQSLLSPIALDSAAFSGPRPNLGSLASVAETVEQSLTAGPENPTPQLSTQKATLPQTPAPPTTLPQTPAPPAPASQTPVPTIQRAQPSTVATRLAGEQRPGTPMVEWFPRALPRPSPLNLQPAQQSAKSISRSSSGDLSDSLEDMKKALELLSPGNSPNPGAFPSGQRISSRDSFALANTLSASVTPSPRWFSRAKARQSRAEPQSTYASSDSAFFRGHVSPRPASASAAMIGPRRNDLQVPISASRLAQFSDTIKSERHRSQQAQQDQATHESSTPSRDAEPVTGELGDDAQVHGAPQHQEPEQLVVEQTEVHPRVAQETVTTSARGIEHVGSLQQEPPRHLQELKVETEQQREPELELELQEELDVADQAPDQTSEPDTRQAPESESNLTTKRDQVEDAEMVQSQPSVPGPEHDQKPTTAGVDLDPAASDLSDSSAYGDEIASKDAMSNVLEAELWDGVDVHHDEDLDELHDAYRAGDHGLHLMEAHLPATQPLRLVSRSPSSAAASAPLDEANRTSVASEDAINARGSPLKRDQSLFGPSSLSMYTLRDGDIEALSGDPEQGMASIERFLRGSAFADSSGIPAVVSGSEEMKEVSQETGSGTVSSLAEDVLEPTREATANKDAADNLEVGTERAHRNGGGSERWSQGSHSQSNWTGASRQSVRSSSNGHDREPGTPVFGYEQPLPGTQQHDSYGDKGDETIMNQHVLVSSPENNSHLFAAARPHVADLAADQELFTSATKRGAASIPTRARSNDERSHIEDAHPAAADRTRRLSTSATSGITTFGMADLGDLHDRALNDDEIRQMTETTRAAVREALSSSSSPHPGYVSQSPITRSPVQVPLSPSPSSPGSIASFASMGRRRTSGLSLNGRKKVAPLNLDIDTSGKVYGAARRSGSASPNQRFRTLPPSPRLIPNQFGSRSSSPLSATFPSSVSNAMHSPTSKLHHASRFEDLVAAPMRTNEDLC